MAHNRTLGEEHFMKKTSNAEYADDRLIDLRQLDHLQFDDVHEAYHLRPITWTGAACFC